MRWRGVVRVGERKCEERFLRTPYRSDVSLSKITPTPTCLKPPFSTVACSSCGCPPNTNDGWEKAELNVSRREKGLLLLLIQVHSFLGHNSALCACFRHLSSPSHSGQMPITIPRLEQASCGSHGLDASFGPPLDCPRASRCGAGSGRSEWE